ncbi:cell envelope integrity protein TolA [Rhizobium leguminosarum]|uniref:cell envelope integrity protein TolA n=1 Tax=Rhizobium leguminosarum TaxID=384 RepID=UPI001C963701|nr:cell envelope integrity protein TolA [Rhizobium leguminosarum]MBY5581030.1 cell envelope integrity protein TolA [Rhizobium leguminosarum]MBY5610749.1 cell envelope integrity protein TolA [Rhizobium leguminosarum]MBY5642425.1 cell envelope integrity protein TolA [Rhizobium leguminosarum]MBY5658643.1 cell envelope integrity protein TolA [Rhizobium leguminosarum]
MLSSLSHFAKSIGPLTMLMAAFSLPPDGHAETMSREKTDSKAKILSVPVIDAMRNAITNRFVLPADLKDAASVHLRFRVRLDRNGRIIGTPDAEVSGGSERTRKIITDAALRAIVRAAPYAMLPKDKYDVWKEVVLNFDVSQLNL